MSGINKRALERDYNYSTFCQWTDDDFYEWSISLFGEHTTKMLKKQEVNAEVLCDYTEDELKALGILSGSIKKIIKFIPSIKKAIEDYTVMSDPSIYTPIKRAEVVFRSFLAPGKTTIPFSSLTATQLPPLTRGVLEFTNIQPLSGGEVGTYLEHLNSMIDAGFALNGTNEATRKIHVSFLLANACNIFNGSRPAPIARVEAESPLGNSTATITRGVADYIIFVRKVPICVIEVKNQNFDKGSLQVIGSAHNIFSTHGREIKVVYGILTDGITWVFQQVRPGNVNESMLVHPVLDRFRWTDDMVKNTLTRICALLDMIETDIGDIAPAPTITTTTTK
ncbi:hypothetical protein SAMD00019534_126490 [Acytostelium subglobosum LB1]|uniref:hypothetical protein n=1 Tax=Acytostelium subglobosum LB1 TaxID=1410327 RepID=UPI000644BDCB|nr:hypothetical protein SAMD00019534_126490 [Acytostelium subglobosum LB1]GAM29473.1 hypothetical protein SAMD00019534_126490 [Acytostelium subglobosum LB1]|eukprot:XP_012747580.1 hypothetical protein SAMD00019534_126490 [Acytostelium subglobosum LB1]